MYTKGPWILTWKAVGGCGIMPNDGHGEIAQVKVRYSKTDNLEEVKANACLIAAAPELLEVCKAILDSEQDTLADGGSILGDDYRSILHEAITKAEGR